MVRFLRILIVCATAWAASDADRFYKAAQKAERAGDVLHAYLLYSRAAALEPQNAEYAAKKAALRGLAALSSRQELAKDPAESTAEAQESSLSPVELRDARDPIAPPRLAGSNLRKNFD